MFASSPGRRVATVLLAVVMASTACTSDDPTPAASDTPAPTTSSPSPSPTPQAPQVVAERNTTWEAVPSASILGRGDNAPPQSEAIRRSLRLVGDWLDAHLTQLHRDGTGLWGQMAADGLAGGDDRDLVTTGLASPDDPVASARYVMTVYYDGAPQFLSVDVTVTHPSGPPSRASLGFVVAQDGTPRLTMFGPAEQEGSA